MKTIIFSLAAVGVLAGAPAAFAQDSTVIIQKNHEAHKDHDHAKTVIKRDDGSKTVIKRHGDKEKTVHVGPAGDKTVIKKKGDVDIDR